MNSLRLDWCSVEAATYACTHWHYSKARQAGKSANVGVWESGKFIGAVIFSAGSGSTTKWASRVSLHREEMAELARVALTKHSTPVSRIVSIAIKMLKRQSPNLRLLVSYADPREGHHGGIYQAGGWIYVGETSKDIRYVDKHGKEYHPRVVSETGFKKQFGVYKPTVVRPSQCRTVEVPGKYKYLMGLDAEIKSTLATLSMPYPKRVASDTIDTATVQVDKGGETPTATLQSL
jgi:hypothetical protein